MEEFNRGSYDYVIATDEVDSHSQALAAGSAGRGGKGGEMGGGGRRRKRKRDREYGVCRGVDFQGVENVVNFDFPTSSDAYIHRVGRWALYETSIQYYTYPTVSGYIVMVYVQLLLCILRLYF